MKNKDDIKSKPARRKSDLTLLGTSSQELEHYIYTLEFGVNLGRTSFEGLNNYSVSITRTDTTTDESETLTSVLEFRLQEGVNTISIEGGPQYDFSVTHKTLDLECTELEKGIVSAVFKGVAWLKGEIKDETMHINRRRVPHNLLQDLIAINLLMSSISTIIGGSMSCHNQVIKSQPTPFTSKEQYIQAMYDTLKEKLDEFTIVAINRGVQHYISTT